MYAQSEISSSRRIDIFLKATHVKRSRYAHQVKFQTPLLLRNRAFQNRESEETLSQWVPQRNEESVISIFWNRAIELMFVRSIREENFELYKKRLKKMLPYFFALDQTHFARWLTIALNDLEKIPKDSNLCKGFASGKFTMNSSSKRNNQE